MLILKLHRDFAVTHNVGEIRQFVTAYGTCGSRKDNLQIVPFFFGSVHWHDGRNGNPLRNGQDIDNCLALSRPAAQRQAPSFQLVDHAVSRKEQQLGVRVRHEEGGHNILFFRCHR